MPACLFSCVLVHKHAVAPPWQVSPVPTVSAITPTTLTLSWTAPNSYGAPILGYQINQQTGSGAFLTAIANTGKTATTLVVTGLFPNTVYSFSIAGINGVGVGLTSNPTASITTPRMHVHVAFVFLLRACFLTSCLFVQLVLPGRSAPALRVSRAPRASTALRQESPTAPPFAQVRRSVLIASARLFLCLISFYVSRSLLPRRLLLAHLLRRRHVQPVFAPVLADAVQPLSSRRLQHSHAQHRMLAVWSRQSQRCCGRHLRRCLFALFSRLLREQHWASVLLRLPRRHGLLAARRHRGLSVLALRCGDLFRRARPAHVRALP